MTYPLGVYGELIEAKVNQIKTAIEVNASLQESLRLRKLVAAKLDDILKLVN